MPLVILTGASGAGKTTIAEAIEHLHGQEFDVFYKDRIGVPPVEEMVDKFGSVKGWQRAATFEWMDRLCLPLAKGRSVLLKVSPDFRFWPRPPNTLVLLPISRSLSIVTTRQEPDGSRSIGASLNSLART